MDVKLHRWLELGWYFIHLPLSDSRRRDYVYERAKLAIDEINVDMVCYTYMLVVFIDNQMLFIYDCNLF